MKEATRLLSRGNQPSVQAIAQAAGISRTTFYRAFPSRARLLDTLKLTPEPDARQRILETAAELLQRQTLAELSMDELAAAAHLSRASVYRLFPGKSALFQALLVAYSPFAPVMALLAASPDRPPDDFIPQLVLTAYRAVAGRQGIVRTLILEVTSLSPETQEPFAQTGLVAFAAIAHYLQTQMEAGRLRAMPPILALQSLVGSVMLHLLAAPVLTRSMPEIPSGEAAVLQLAQQWLRGMRPES